MGKVHVQFVGRKGEIGASLWGQSNEPDPNRKKKTRSKPKKTDQNPDLRKTKIQT